MPGEETTEIEQSEETTEIEQSEGVENEEELEETEEIDDNEGEEEESELVDVELDGVTYKLPEAVKKATMLHADYTQKTTSLAQEKNELAQTKQQFQEEQQFIKEHTDLNARVHSLNSQLAEFEQVDWPAYQLQDPEQAQAMFMRYQQLKDHRDRANGELGTKLNEMRQRKEQQLANLTAQAETTLMRDIPDWSPTKAVELNQFAASHFGFNDADLQAAKYDARIMKLINLAHVGYKSSQKTKPRTPGQKVVTPTKKVVGKKSKVVKQNDTMDINDWMDMEMKKPRN